MRILWRQHSLAESPPGRVGLLEPTTTRERRCMPNRNSQPQNSKSPGGRHTTRHRRRRRVSSACVHATRTRSNKRTHFLKPTADDQALGECFCPKHLPLSHATKSRCSRVAQAAGGPAHTDFSPQKHRRLLASFALITHHSSVARLSFLFHSEETRRPN